MAVQVCTYCGSSWTPTQDHVIAQVKGGVTTVSACSRCNNSKGDKALMDWFRWLKKNDVYRWNQIVNHNTGRRSTIAKKVQKVRDEK